MSAAAGSENAGAGFAGIGSTPTIPAARNVRLPHALYLDLSVMDFPLDANGRYVEVHPVDHLALMLIGPFNDLWQTIEIADQATMTRRADEIVRQRWADLIARGDIADVTTIAKPGPNGRARIDISYRNTRDPASNPAKPFRTVEIG